MISYSGQKLFLFFLPSYYFFVALYSFFGILVFDFGKEVPFDLYSKIDLDYIKISVIVLIMSGVCFILGWFLAFKISKKNLQSKSFRFQISLTKKMRRFFLYFGLFLFAFYIFSYGYDGILERRSYTNFYGPDTRNHTLLIIYNIIMPFVILGLSFVQVSYLRYFLLIINLLPLIASTTRLSGLMLFIYAVGRFIRNDLNLNIKIFILLLFSMYLFVGSLAIRGTSPQGLVFNLSNLFLDGFVISLFTEGLNYITSFSTFVLAYSFEFKEGDWYSTLVSLSPLPSGFHDMARMLESQTLISSVPAPMSAIAILYSHGYIFGMMFYFSLGFILYRISRQLHLNPVFFLLMLFLTMVATLFSLQYNLRGMMRLLYLMFFIYISFSLFRALRFR